MPKKIDPYLRFSNKIKINDKTRCWEWTGSIDRSFGYGTFRLDGKSIKAHRASYQLFREDIGDLFVLHKCDNPPCVNPAHLFLGTLDDNNKDRAAKGRSAPVHGEYNGHAKLTNKDVEDLRFFFENTGCSIAELSRLSGVNHRTLYDCVTYKTWSHI